MLFFAADNFMKDIVNRPANIQPETIGMNSENELNISCIYTLCSYSLSISSNSSMIASIVVYNREFSI